MNYKVLLSQVLGARGRRQMPLSLTEIRSISPRLQSLRQRLALPDLQEEQIAALARNNRPALRRALLLCVETLRRRPELAAELGIDAQGLSELCRAAAAAEALADLSGKALRDLQDGQLLLTEKLARLNRKARATMEAVAQDGTVPIAERNRAAIGAGVLDSIKAARGKRRRDKQRRLERRAAPYTAAREAAEETRSAAAAAIDLLGRPPRR